MFELIEVNQKLESQFIALERDPRAQDKDSISKNVRANCCNGQKALIEANNYLIKITESKDKRNINSTAKTIIELNNIFTKFFFYCYQYITNFI